MGIRYPFENHFLALSWEIISPGLSVLGLVIRIATVGFAPKGTSGRGTKSMRAETLNTTGMYSIVRHPLYLGNFLIFLGVLLYVGSWHILLIGVLAFWLYYERIILGEEAFLNPIYGETFRQWAATTPAFIPRLSQWRKPVLNFSVRSVIRREYHSLAGVILVLVGVEVGRDYSVYHHFEIAPQWDAIFLFGVVFYVVARFVTKRTHLLDAADR